MSMTTGTHSRLVGREIRLAARPVGEPSQDDLELVQAEMPPLGEGQILVRNTWMSVDPYIRGRMDETPSYIAPFQVCAALEGSAVGEVVASRAASIPLAATVSHFLGWREYAVLDAAEATLVDTAIAPAQAYLGMLINDHLGLFPAYSALAAGWLADGSLHTEETAFDGLEAAPAAFLGVLSGANTGKMLVRLDA